MNRHFLTSLVAALVHCAISASGEAPFSLASTPGQLPKDVVPTAYDVRIQPDVETAAFRGSVEIRVDVKKPVKAFVLNALGLQITDATLAQENPSPLKILLDEKSQTLTLTAPKELAPGSHTLAIRFNGILTEQPHGLFLTRYATPTGDKRALMTQFEATDARRMFPCWDEPVYRARFTLTAVVPDKHVAVSNMPIERERKLADGLKEIVFAQSPPMATYLLAFCAGEFEMLEDEVDGIKLRIFTTQGKREQGRYAMEATKKILPYFNEYFGVKYPLPKLDQLSFASTGASGMENWGCITYHDTALLFDPATSSQRTKESVFAVVAHEIAHQWFGDLVTMAWWDNLWLNEGFASWMGTKATDRFNPEWKTWLRAAGFKQHAMSLDARATTHPIQQPIANESQASDAFDEITYGKGQAFLRMLESWLGEEKFRDGLRVYMKRHALGSTTTADLWAALGEVSGQPVSEMAANWTEQPGFPLVNIHASGGKVRISQERFTVHQRDPKSLQWKIPVTVGDPLGRSAPRTELLAPGPIEIESATPLKANWGDPGYFRVAYDAETFAALAKGVRALPEADRLNLVNDTWALVTAARSSISAYLELVSHFQDEREYAVLSSILWSFAEIDFLARGQASRKSFHAWARNFLQPHLARLGWEPKLNESPLDGLLRAAVVRDLADFGDETTLKTARARFEKFLAEPASLTGDLRGAVLTVVGHQADDATYEKLRLLAKNETSTEQKRLLYGALAGSLDPRHAEKTLALALTDELIPRAATHLVVAVGADGEQPERAWAFTKSNLKQLSAKLSALDQNDYVPRVFGAFSDDAHAAELEAFAREALPPDAEYSVSKTADEIRFRAEMKARVLPEIDAWCRKHLAP